MKKILVVEDNDFVRLQLVRFLNGAYETVEAARTDTALEKVRDGIDLVITDIHIQPMDGFDFIRAMRGLNIDIPFIFATGDQSVHLLSRALELGASALLRKPVPRDKLLEAVGSALLRQGGA